MVGPEGVLPALVLPLLSPAITAEFSPGRVDHHSVVVLLTLAMVLTAVEGLRRPRMAMVCGLLAATALAIATESLPGIGAAILVMGMVWVKDPARGALTRGFGVAFAGASVLHLMLARPPARWLEAACDMISPVYVAGALVVGAAFLLVSVLPAPRRAWHRLLILGTLGLAGGAGIVIAYPDCLGGPYGQLDPWLREHWIGAIVEARPWGVSVIDIPAYALAAGVPVLAAVLVVCWRLWRVEAQREDWATLLVFLLATGLVMLVQLRGARLALMPAMPAAAWLIVTLRQRYLARPRLGQALALAGGWLAFAGLVLSLVVTMLVGMVPGRAQQVAQARASKAPCLVPTAFADLAGLPPERIMSPIDLGSHLLLKTPHAVVAAPYHRNEQGVLDAFRFFNEPIEAAREILDERGVGLVVICPAMAEMRGLAGAAEDSFVRLWENDSLPAWLAEESLPDSPLKVYAVLPR